MPKFSVNATELSNTDVNFVALVKRGANRIPFRITKSEEADMINLHTIGQRLFKSDVQPAVVAVFVEKGADMPKISAVLKSAGIDVATFEKSDQSGKSSYVLKSDLPPQDVALFKMAGGVYMAVSNVAKAFDAYDFQSPNFNDVHAKGSHMDAMAAAGDSLRHTMSNIMDNAKDPKEASKQISDACDAHKAHVAKLTHALPEQAFKADVALAKAFQAAGGTDDDQQTEVGIGDPGAKDPEMPPANAKKADAGKNGTGAGAELGERTGTDDRSTADDKANTEVNAKPGAAVSGDASGMPAGAKAPTKKSAAVLKAELAVAQAQLALAKFDGDGDEDDAMVDDDASTNGAQDDLPEGAKAPTKTGGVNKTAQTTDVTTQEITGESQAGEGAAQGADKRPEDRADAEAGEAGGKVAGKTKGKTLDMEGVPAGAKAPTAAGGVNKNDGDADIGKKGKGKTLPKSQSGAGAQEADAQTLKSDDPVMKAIQALSKSVKDSLAVVSKSVTDLNARVDQVASMAKKNDAALNGTVFADAGDDNVRARKSEGSGAPPLLDTAYTRRGAA